jgi:hypothetical protein
MQLCIQQRAVFVNGWQHSFWAFTSKDIKNRETVFGGILFRGKELIKYQLLNDRKIKFAG